MARREGKNVDVGVESSEYRAKKSDDVPAKKAKAVEHNLRANTIIIAGSARLPENTTAKHVFGHLTIELEIDHSDSTIVDFSCTLSPSLGEKMLRNALLRSKIEEGIRDAVKQLEERFSGATKKAMIAALEDTYKQYKKYLKK